MKNFLKSVFLTAMFVGTTDIISAFVTAGINTGKIAERMFNYIAGGAVGVEAAMKGGTLMALLGLFLHYFISFAFTLFFFWIFPKVKFLSFNKYLVGMFYAVFVDLVMGQLILPLTSLPPNTFNLSRSFIGWITLGVIFGIPIAFNAYKYYGVKAGQ